MGSHFGPLMANVFMGHLEEEVTRDGLMPQLYKRYVDDTLARMPSADIATEFLSTLNALHPSLSFTVELPVDKRSLLLALKSSRMELDLKAKFTENQQTLDCSYTSKVTQINAIRTLY